MEYLRSATHKFRGITTVVPLDKDDMSSTETLIREDSITLPPQIATRKGSESPQRQDYGPESRRTPKHDGNGHGRLVLKRWDKFLDIISGRETDLAIDGESLDLAVIVAVARYAPQISCYIHISILTGQTMQ